MKKIIKELKDKLKHTDSEEVKKAIRIKLKALEGNNTVLK